MSISHAHTFLRRFEKEVELRRKCHSCNNHKQLMDLLRTEKLNFTPLELENTFNILLVHCQSHEQGAYVKQLISCLSRFMQPR